MVTASLGLSPLPLATFSICKSFVSYLESERKPKGADLEDDL